MIELLNFVTLYESNFICYLFHLTPLIIWQYYQLDIHNIVPKL
jgi:hypothetical protein